MTARLWDVGVQVAAALDAGAASSRKLERDAELRAINLDRLCRVTEFLVSSRLYKWQPVRV